MSGTSRGGKHQSGDPRKRTETRREGHGATRAEKLEMSCRALVDTLDWFHRLKAPQALLTDMEDWVYTVRLAAIGFGPGDWETADCFIRDGMSLLDAMLAADKLRE